MNKYLRNRFYLRGATPLGLLNTLLAGLFNRVLVRCVDKDTGKTIHWFWGRGTDFPRETEVN